MVVTNIKVNIVNTLQPTDKFSNTFGLLFCSKNKVCCIPHTVAVAVQDMRVLPSKGAGT